MPDANPRVANTDLRVGDKVMLKSGGPEMTVIGNVDGDIRVSWFGRMGDDYEAEIQTTLLPRNALECVEE